MLELDWSVAGYAGLDAWSAPAGFSETRAQARSNGMMRSAASLKGDSKSAG